MESLSLIVMACGFFIVAIIILFSIIALSRTNLEKQLKRNANMVIKAQNEIINENKEILKDTADKSADINKDAVRVLAHSVKEGLTEDSDTCCKYCGARIDADSRFCKSCGKPL